MNRTPLITITLAAILAACAGSTGAPGTQPPSPSPSPSPSPASPPWSATALARTQVPQPFLDSWNAAENRNTCALVAFTRQNRGATPRTATFSGGWAVAYDMPDLRSAYGIAGAGSKAADESYVWPDRITWSDGSNVTYGPEGGTGPNQLAYLRINGQGCLYNVWSRLGKDHLVELLNSIRFVER